MPVDPHADMAAPGGAGSRPAARGGHPVSRRVLAAIALGGALGGPARYALGLAFPTAPGGFPATTFAINVSGSFALALLVVFVMEIWPPTTYVRPFAGIGFLGAYTTFSTWMVDADSLIASGRYWLAAAYLAASLVAGLAAASLGLSVGRGYAAARRRAHGAGRRRASSQRGEAS